MAEYITTTDQNVALNQAIPFNSVSVPCNRGSVIPVAPGEIILRGGARYEVTLQGNIMIPTGGAVTAVALGIALNGSVLPESVAIYTAQAVEEYRHIHVSVPINVPSGCCVSVSGHYVDGTEDDAAVTPTPSITVRRGASLSVVQIQM